MTVIATPCRRGTAGSVISGIFGGFCGIAAALALALLMFPSAQYVTLSNYLQILVAFAGAAVFCWYYLRHEAGSGFLWAAAAFALWGAANIAWYAAVFFKIGTFPFPGPIDLGFVVAILLLSSAYKRIYPRKQVNGPALLVLLVLVLIIPLAILATAGVTDQSLMILLYFFACGLLLITAFNYSFTEHPAALAGTILFALAFMVYPLRESYLSGNALLAILGPCVAAGLSFVVIGLLPDGTVSQETPKESSQIPE
ncbi:hypothetical protein [Methanoregula sp. UBA64]|jgi:hypothetical protein|uniref:hypothetical protein n=1 Tax=Methanoregula sp. UBA64 TaxID=1915554 RepID=UPI0025CD78B1|nr:hypothetical protein [Methanoregula sp. UBA64]